MEEADFSGFATKAGLKCSDGRTITSEAFKHQDKIKVPLVWQHGHKEPGNVLGHAILEHREGLGVYAYGFFNKTKQAVDAKEFVQHGDITNLSIYASGLVEKSKVVMHGNIKEVSLVLSGANPGAVIDNVNIRHADGDVEELDDEVIIFTDATLEHTNMGNTPKVVDDVVDEVVEHAAGDGPTVQDIYDTLTDEQKQVVNYMIGAALDQASSDSASHSDIDEDSTLEEVYHSFDDIQKEAVEALIEAAVEEKIAAHTDANSDTLTHQEGTDMTNVFETDATGKAAKVRKSLSHEQMKTIMTDGARLGSLKESFLEHADDYGIDNIDYLFPDAKTISNTPEYISRRMEWVTNVLSSVKKSPFSRVKSIVADITADEARAKGYVKGNLKKDEVIRLLKRVTLPKTIYKKQKLDRDDIIDIVDLDVVAWLKAEMRIMLDEEIAAAILVGDGREPDDEDKIDEDHVRPIAYDVDMYNTTITLPGSPTPSQIIDAVLGARVEYKGTGTPTFYTTDAILTALILGKDTLGRRFYDTEAELASAMRVSTIVVVEAMERAPDVVGVLVNLTDYTVGADRGGEISMFDDFDIDYNQQKYLIETRISGALTKPKSAVTIKANPGTVVVPTAPTFVSGTGVVTIPTVAGVTYKNEDTGTTLTAGAQTALAVGATLNVLAVPASGSYSFAHGTDTDWTFTRP